MSTDACCPLSGSEHAELAKWNGRRHERSESREGGDESRWRRLKQKMWGRSSSNGKCWPLISLPTVIQSRQFHLSQCSKRTKERKAKKRRGELRLVPYSELMRRRNWKQRQGSWGLEEIKYWIQWAEWLSHTMLLWNDSGIGSLAA